MTTYSDDEIIERAQSYAPDVQTKVVQRVKGKLATDRHIWYCTRGRICDGLPHDGAPYRHARGSQWPPPQKDWLLWLIISGRGWGKTRTGAEWTRAVSKHAGRIAAIARRGVDFRATMVEGDSGLEAVCRAAGISYDYQPSKKEFRFENGSTVFGYSAEEPDSLRGPQHHAFWADEPSHFDDPPAVWDNLLFGLRLPGVPGGARGVATTTPLPNPWTKERIKEETTIPTRGSTYENLENLDPVFRKTVLDKYEGTRQGKQELYGEILLDTPGALWKTDSFQPLPKDIDWRDMQRIVVFIDPAGSTNKKSDETGIVVAGKMGTEYYVLADATAKYSPAGWAKKAIALYEQFKADAIGAEKNFGGDMVKATVQTELDKQEITAKVIVTTASRSKELRAEPIAALYEQKRVYHVAGLKELEDEMCEWVPGKGKSPNRIDATVWGITELSGKGQGVIQAAAVPETHLPNVRAAGFQTPRGIYG